MRILIAGGVLADLAYWHDLEALLDRAGRKKCYVDALDPAMSTTNPWLDQADPRRQAEWRNASDWAAMDAALFRLRTFVVDAKADASTTPPRITFADAIELADQTACLWVENGRNDRRFFLGMMSVENRAAFEEWEHRRIIEFKGGGGLGEARKGMEDLATRGRLDPRMNRALFDSDGEVPGHRSRGAELMAEFCEGKAIAYHCLVRRAIENYLPRKALWAWATAGSNRATREVRTAKLEAFKRMSDPQRYHFHLKSGWVDAPSEAVTALYTDIAKADYNVLANGIDKDIASLYDTYADYMHEWAYEEGIDAGLRSMIDEITDWIRVPYA